MAKIKKSTNKKLSSNLSSVSPKTSTVKKKPTVTVTKGNTLKTSISNNKKLDIGNRDNPKIDNKVNFKKSNSKWKNGVDWREQNPNSPRYIANKPSNFLELENLKKSLEDLIPTGDYVEETEVKDFDEVDKLSADTKKEGTIYIGDDGYLYIYKNGEYKKTSSPDTNCIPIYRDNNNENIEPTSTELNNFPLVENTYSIIYLKNRKIEVWRYTNTWNKQFTVNPYNKHYSIIRDNFNEDIKPTSTETNNDELLQNDTSIVYLSEDDKLIAIEKYVYNGNDWEKDSIRYLASSDKIDEVTKDLTIDKDSDISIYEIKASDNLTITLPNASDIKGFIYRFKVSELSEGKIVTLSSSDKIDNEDEYTINHNLEYVSIVSNGNTYLIINHYRLVDSGNVNSLIGDWVFKYRGSMSDEDLESLGYFPLKGGTYTDYKAKYPIASVRIPQSWISGNDWVIPNDVEGTFLRNIGGNAGNEGEFQDDDIKPHTHSYTKPSSDDRFGDGSSYGDYATYHPSTLNTGTAGNTETRPKNYAIQLCIIVDTIGKVLTIPDSLDVAKSVTITINGGSTLVNNKSSETIYAGVGAYRLLIDVPDNKMLDINQTSNDFTIIDAHQGIIETQLDRTFSEDSKDLTIDFVDLPQEKLLNTTFIFTENVSFAGADETLLFETDNYIKLNSTKIEIDVRLPYRSNETAWGGAYTNLYYSVDNGNTWVKFFNSGYDAVMYNNSKAIESFNFSGILDFDEVKSSEQIKFKVTGQTYNSKTVLLNESHDIKTVDTDTNLGYANINIKEIGTIYGLNPNYSPAPVITVNFNGLTVENGKSSLSLIENNFYHVKVDLTPDKRLSSVTCDETNVSIVDSENGFIAIDLPLNTGNVTITLQDEDKPQRTNDYCLDPNPEGITDFEMCILYTPLVGNCPLVKTNPDNFFIDNGQYIKVDDIGSPHSQLVGDGIGGGTFDFAKVKTYTNYNWNLNKRSFVISYWVKAYESVDSMYNLGNDIASTTGKSLHIGWRDSDTFTLAFYARDVNWDNPNGINRADTVDKWFHYVLAHDCISLNSKLFINGEFVSELTHKDSYESYLNMINCTQNVARTKSKISNLRIFTNGYEKGGYVLTDNQIQNIYTQEKKVLEEM